jgi:ATP-dependent Clp protease ATP-binding subunit ClpC
MKANVMNELKRTFNPEFLNRIDEVVMFHPLHIDHMYQIIDIMLERLNDQMAEQGIALEIDDSAKTWLAQQGFDPSYGARPLRRALRRLIEDPLSEEVLRGEFAGGGVVQIKLAGTELAFVAKEKDAVESLSDN